jgi:hypothetical protein
VGFEIPGQGVFVGRNITPDKETGIRSWIPEEIVKAIQTGERPDGRILAPIMPWHAFAKLTADDAMAIAAFLQSLNPVSNQLPGPFKPGKRFRPSCSGLCHQAKPQRLRPSRLGLTKTIPALAWRSWRGHSVSGTESKPTVTLGSLIRQLSR